MGRGFEDHQVVTEGNMHLSVSAGQKRILPLLLGVFFITIAAGAQDLPNGKPESLRRTT
jgi:hypothetical protein